MSVTLLLIAFAVVFALGLGYLAYRMASSGGAVGARMDELRAAYEEKRASAIDTARRKDSKLMRTAEAAGAFVPVSPRGKWLYRRMLIQAGYRGRGALGALLGARIIFAGGLGSLAFTSAALIKRDPQFALLLGVMGGVIGALIPMYWLKRKLRARKTEIFHTLPDILDLMTVCVEAGLGLEAAIIKISEEREFSKKVLAQELKIVGGEIRAGKARTDALRDLGDRTGVEDIKSLVALLIQTEKLGASLARSLRVHSDSLRTKRRQMAEEKAAKTSVKLLFPLVLFIFPSLLVVLLGPGLIKIYETFSK